MKTTSKWGALAGATQERAPAAGARRVQWTNRTQAKACPCDKEGDNEAVAAWRERMATPQAKAIYPQRAATAECVNALARQRGLTHLRVRGTAKVRCILLLHALAHNLMRTVALAPQLLGDGGGASGQPVMAT